ncbi:MAG: hypothetical protein Q4F18_11125 [Clostridia bacterium]|nr:hypothetical protein [Clostridia bacterium]
MNAWLEERLRDLKDRQLAGEHMPCPRCGRDVMKDRIHTNALSRHADIYICDECGTAEALLDAMSNPLPLACWAAVREQPPKSDLKTLTGAEAMERVRAEQVPFLTELYERWRAAPPGADFEEYRREAVRECPGMTRMWKQPFSVEYATATGRLLIQFSTGDSGTQVKGFVIDR